MSTYAGASLSKVNKNNTSQKIVYTVFTGNSAAVKRRGNKETCPETARGRNAPKYRRSRRATRLKGMMTSKIAFSWTCQPNRNEAYPQRVTAPTNVSHVGVYKRRRRTGYRIVSKDMAQNSHLAYNLSAERQEKTCQRHNVGEHSK